MSDRTYMQIDILECPPANAGKVLQALVSYGFADESDTVLRLGPDNRYYVEESGIGNLIYELGPELQGLCSFSGWEDPRYEYSGTHVSSIMKSTGPSEIVINECLQNGMIIVTATAALDAARKGELGKLLRQDHYELLDTVYEKAVNGPQEVPVPHYVIIERQNGPSLAVRYPDNDTAQWALESSFFIDSLCQEDCLDAYVSDHVDEALRERTANDPHGLEEVVPPGDDSSVDDSVVPASLADWETEGVDSV